MVHLSNVYGVASKRIVDVPVCWLIAVMYFAVLRAQSQASGLPLPFDLSVRGMLRPARRRIFPVLLASVGSEVENVVDKQEPGRWVSAGAKHAEFRSTGRRHPRQRVPATEFSPAGMSVLDRHTRWPWGHMIPS